MIKEFRGEYAWLSNFYAVKIILLDVEYASVEHAYMSAKSDDPEWKFYCQNTIEAGKVKTASRQIKIKDNWEDIKINVMFECLIKKFEQEPFRTKLIETGDKFIMEGNWWGDEFWGVNLKNNKGKNYLGKLITTIRNNLKNETYIKIN